MIIRILNIILASVLAFILASPVQAERAFYSAFSLVPGATALGQVFFQSANTPSTPAISFNGDGDTGIYNSGANIIGLSTGGLARFTLDASGALTQDATNGGNIVFNRTGAAVNWTVPGFLTTSGANALQIQTNSLARWTFGATGDLTQDATNGGDVIFSRSGRTISLQEATASTACMGVATPNGTTNVTVTTSCAVTGARVFYSRVGAVTNMGTISTTTNPNGTSFTFASVNAADTLASSVVYMIVKEAA